jgi:L-ribulose-5-phosphate 3-epimerase UlaE
MVTYASRTQQQSDVSQIVILALNIKDYDFISVIARWKYIK